jgi:hypothetical protein
VLEAPWPARNRWQHWRRVRFDDGETLIVDTAAGPAFLRALRAERAVDADLARLRVAELRRGPSVILPTTFSFICGITYQGNT